MWDGTRRVAKGETKARKLREKGADKSERALQALDPEQGLAPQAAGR